MLPLPNPPDWWTGSSTDDQSSFTGHNDLDHTNTVKTSFGPSQMPSTESRDHPIRTGFQNSVGPDSNRTSSTIVPSVGWNSSAIYGKLASSISRKTGRRMNQPGMVSRKQKASTESNSVVSPAAEGLQRTENSQPRSINDLEQVRSTGTGNTQGMTVEEPTNPSYPFSSMMSLWLSIPAMALKKSLRQHAHAITRRDAVALPEEPTFVRSMSVSPSQSQSPNLPTYFPHNTTEHSETNNITFPTVAASISVNGSSVKTLGSKKMPAIVTNDAFSSQSSVTDPGTGSINGSLGTSLTIPPRVNVSSAPELLSRTNVSRVPTTPRGHWGSGNQSGPDLGSICLTKMDIVWVVLAISVPVSSCCEYLALYLTIGDHSLTNQIYQLH